MVDHSTTNKKIFDDGTRLINAGLAQGVTDAQFAVKNLRIKTYSSRIFYIPSKLVSNAIDSAFDYLGDISSYERTDLKTGKVEAGRIGRLKDIFGIALGEVVKFESRDKSETYPVVRVHYAYEDKNGFFLTPHHYDGDREDGKKLVDERENLHRIEFDRFIENYVLGMFVAWKEESPIPSVPLVLYADLSLDKLLGIEEK